MAASVPASLNEQLNRAYFQEFTADRPSTDPVFSRVNNIAFHCLYTGVLVLTCASPDLLKYRQVPQSRMAELRAAISVDWQIDIQHVLEQITREIRTQPDTYYPSPFTVLVCKVDQHSRIVIESCFAKMRLQYEINANGRPNNPYQILDIVSHPIDENSEYRIDFLMKRDESGMRDFVADASRRSTEYVALLNKLRTGLLDMDSPHVGIPSEVLTELREKMSDPDSFFKEFVFEYEKLLRRPHPPMFVEYLTKILVAADNPVNVIS